ncbi:hypothetical protein [Streptomyces sp. B1I3]|uniref:hypothetical protein n=1 Tax=Streptomyces sp. B1I3 TaxID=3042264 RepID=UPI0027863464|nr:hypothetical protein [Streptomyces sp. B1I3]MDQ0791670.1 hypothetical protein [Streptomyces sp. B1I3]
MPKVGAVHRDTRGPRAADRKPRKKDPLRTRVAAGPAGPAGQDLDQAAQRGAARPTAGARDSEQAEGRTVLISSRPVVRLSHTD